MEWKEATYRSSMGYWVCGSCKTTKRVNKLKDRSNVMVFIGYELGTKAYICLDPLSFKVTISRDVVFEEFQSWDFSQ